MFGLHFLLYLFFSFAVKTTDLSQQAVNISKTETALNHQNNEGIQLTEKKIVSLSIILIIIIFLLFYYIYQNNKLKQKIKRKDTKQKILLDIINSSIDSQEIERKKIASFLHDNINSLLSSAGLHLNTFTVKKEIKSEEIIKAKTILSQAHELLRDMSHDLVPSLLVRFGLIYALEDLCEKNSNSAISFEFSSSIPTNKRYIEKFEMKIYFIVSELFNNIIKHSKAKKAKLSIIEKNAQLILRIEDDGIGFKTQKPKDLEGFGLNRIRARIKKYKGTISINSKENTGTQIKIQIPLPH
ncbi:sensor histidine kinase [Flavobacterium chungbukense]|uniref:histidine kinase n=1 Tax=Flavobacterium chungbukense TaxID=877464 RepID=A0ABP7YJU8_9FLAO|nr:ATP-binding protein [Flavobacterium chungbukense]MCC4920084.1 GHKL domain-containing protein [Flavobacterium chungbukense]